MKDVGRDVPEVSRRRLLQELEGLFGPAFGPALEAYGRPFAELIARDEDFRVEVRDRFERGRAYGGFPVLSALLSHATPEEQETFFETGWIRLVLPPSGPPREPWDRVPWVGDREAYREDLYSGLAFAFTDLRAFAREWLEELLRVGYYGMEEYLGLPLKQQAGARSPAPDCLPLYGQSYPVRLEGTRQTVWLSLDGPRSEEGGYREVTVSDEPLRTDGAFFACARSFPSSSLPTANPCGTVGPSSCARKEKPRSSGTSATIRPSTTFCSCCATIASDSTTRPSKSAPRSSPILAPTST